MKILTAAAVLLFLAAIVDLVTPQSNAGITIEQDKSSELITAADVQELMTCSAVMMMISKSSTKHPGETSPLFEAIAEQWLRVSLFFAPTVSEDYLEMIDSYAVTSLMHAENLYGAKGQQGLFSDFYKRCNKYDQVKQEVVKFLRTQSNA